MTDPVFRRHAGGLIVAATLAAGSLIAGWVPQFSERLAYRRTAVLEGDWLRLIGAHFSHWSVPHLAANLIMLALVVALCARHPPKLRWPVTALAACSATLVGLVPAIEQYRGASGLIAVYVPYVLAELWYGPRHGRAVALALVTGYLGRLALDAGGLMPSPVLPPGVRSVWEVHLAGFSVGVLGRWSDQRRRSSRPSS